MQFLLLMGSSVSTAGTSDFDGNGYVDPRDFRYMEICLSLSGPNKDPSFTECRSVFDSDDDRDVDLKDIAAFQAARGHLPIPLRDSTGGVIHVADTDRYYDGRRTCGECHDVATIENGFLFQQGRTDLAGNVIMQDDCLGDGRPWVRSTGMYGAWRPRVNRWMASKHFENESEIDQSAFWWTANCSGCHPGGGGMEFDQDGERFFDYATGRFGYEELGKAPEDVVFDVDYANINSNTGAGFGVARWDLTGVAAPDCMMCHRLDRTYSAGWDMNRAWRAGVLAAGKDLRDPSGAPVPAFTAAATAGQGWFSNLVFTRFPDMYPLVSTLQISYAAGVADGSLISGADGAVSLSPTSLAFPPTDRACFACHQPSWLGKRGSVWFDSRDVHYAGFNNLRDEDPGNDIPADRSIACRECHLGDINHNFAKGKSQFNIFRDELDWVNLRTCGDCHLEKLADGTANPLKHPKAPAVPGSVLIHEIGLQEGELGPMRSMSCQACHIPYALARARIGVDNSVTGSGVTYWADSFLSADPLNPASPDKSRWYPEFRLKVDKDGVSRLFPAKVDFAIYWADWNQNGTPVDRNDDTIAPIILWRVKQITGNVALPIVVDDNGDGKKELNRPEEILAYMQALKGNDSYGRQVASNPVLVKGTSVWYEDPAAPGGVNSFDHRDSGILVEFEEVYELHPPVLAKTASLGYDAVNAELGCRDCHRPDTLDSPVFDRLVLVDPWGPDGQPVYQKVREITGSNPP